jgi:hypothetical protein
MHQVAEAKCFDIPSRSVMNSRRLTRSPRRRVLVLEDALTLQHRQEIIDFTIQKRVTGHFCSEGMGTSRRSDVMGRAFLICITALPTSWIGF